MTSAVRTSLSRPGATLNVLRWVPENDKGAPITPKGVVQIVHGMVEYANRYAKFAEYLVSQGYAVVAHDHRGHGMTKTDAGIPGYFADYGGWNLILEDLHAVRQYVDAEFPGSKHYILGHSMGSLLTRNYIAKYGEGLTGVIIMGTVSWPGAKGDAGMKVANLLAKIRPTAPGKLLNTLTFADYNKGFERRTKFDWLTRDHKVVDAYIADDKCGFVPTNAFFRDLLVGTHYANSSEAYEKAPDELPLFVVSGAVDPAGGAACVTEVVGKYLNAGKKDVRFKVYPDGRHEILNELNKEEVYSDIVAWLESR
ncbi:alpha/beta hydrolase [Corynebacterium sp. HMSC064E08]|uniref:alpha/beta hydrolase n=1 Tax=Corynebacterium TaxID=1716 RepID=UPI0008A50AF3|nr:alpha/beta hydrolase [Corynebacterium sp. HMSC064E08]OFK30627.1 alpha/beta hydrolase [Corynebacterium sp. HMSC064E08]